MNASSVRSRLIRLHRWIGLVAAPVLVVILVTGIPLALRPLIQPVNDPGPTGAVDVHRVTALLDSVERSGPVAFAGMEDDRRTLTLFLQGEGKPRSFDLATGAAVPTPPPTPPDLWDRILDVHKDLWFGLGGLATLGTLGMLVLVLIGPLAGRPAFAPVTPREWHGTIGWLLWPLVALLPVSVVLMKLHSPVVIADGASAMALAPALTKASASLDLSRFQGVQRIRSSTAVMLIRGPEGFRRYVLHPDRVAPLDTRASRIGHMLHEGTWAGPWSGMMNAFAALLDLGLIGLGVASLLSRRRRHTRAARAETPQRVGAA